MTTLWLIVLCGALAIAYAIWATSSVLRADAGSARMQEISAAVREGAQAYLKRQYSTIGVVGIVILVLILLLAWFTQSSPAQANLNNTNALLPLQTGTVSLTPMPTSTVGTIFNMRIMLPMISNR